LVARPPGRPNLVGIFVEPSIRVVALPVPHQPSTRALLLNRALIKGCVELKNETLILLDLAALLG
jgi:hypothetical protein